MRQSISITTLTRKSCGRAIWRIYHNLGFSRCMQHYTKIIISHLSIDFENSGLYVHIIILLLDYESKSVITILLFLWTIKFLLAVTNFLNSSCALFYFKDSLNDVWKCLRTMVLLDESLCDLGFKPKKKIRMLRGK